MRTPAQTTGAGYHIHFAADMWRMSDEAYEGSHAYRFLDGGRLHGWLSAPPFRECDDVGECLSVCLLQDRLPERHIARTIPDLPVGTSDRELRGERQYPIGLICVVLGSVLLLCRAITTRRQVVFHQQ